ncbi:MAG TPA: cellulose synthase subunit BcsC-related outer membrane protein [Stellaceae bacterium]|nr:cellulose synthase subunit BcsC-related outer membrane protein [Stellaceae bacterium]
MRGSPGRVAFGLLLSVALPAGSALAADPGEQLLLERANYWRLQHRPDLADEFVAKVLALNPAQPDALYQHALLAAERGNKGEAQQYLDRLRQLAASDPRAAELVTPAPTSGPAPARAAASPARSAPAAIASPARSAPVAMAAVPAARPDAASAAPSGVPAAPVPAPALVVASADSADLIPDAPAQTAIAAAAPPVTAFGAGDAAATGALARNRQLAALPETTIADGDTGISVTAPTIADTTPSDIDKPKPLRMPVQTAQLELMPPLPVGGYQRPTNVTPYSPSDTLEIDIDRNLTQLEAQSNPMLVAGAGFRWHDGTSGLSQLTEFGFPVEASFSPWYTGTARLAVLPVYIDPGSISSSNYGIFGANPALLAKGLPAAAPGSQTVAGVGILGGYSYGDLSGQFGTSPLGFPVTNLVGSVAYAPKFYNDFITVRLEGLRQPVTDSVLSYAGTHANLSAANAVTSNSFGSNGTWGGVVRTGGHVTLFYDDQMYGAYGGAGMASLTGQNVAENNQLDALLGAYFRPWKTDNWAIRVGVAGYYTSYNKNLGGFTFGQGGYFSPQNLESLTFPVEYTGHAGPWSWLASVALGVQHFNTNSSLIFPNNVGAQTVLASSGATSAFGGGSSTGLGAALQGQIEYAIDPSLSVGAAASYNNGNDYNEVIAKLYLRKTFDWFAPVAVKNDPASIAARDLPQARL